MSTAFRPCCPDCHEPVALNRAGLIRRHVAGRRRCPASRAHWATAHTRIP